MRQSASIAWSAYPIPEHLFRHTPITRLHSGSEKNQRGRQTRSAFGPLSRAMVEVAISSIVELTARPFRRTRHPTTYLNSR